MATIASPAVRVAQRPHFYTGMGVAIAAIDLLGLRAELSISSRWLDGAADHAG